MPSREGAEVREAALGVEATNGDRRPASKPGRQTDQDERPARGLAASPAIPAACRRAESAIKVLPLRYVEHLSARVAAQHNRFEPKCAEMHISVVSGPFGPCQPLTCSGTTTTPRGRRAGEPTAGRLWISVATNAVARGAGATLHPREA